MTLFPTSRVLRRSVRNEKDTPGLESNLPKTSGVVPSVPLGLGLRFGLEEPEAMGGSRATDNQELADSSDWLAQAWHRICAGWSAGTLKIPFPC